MRRNWLTETEVKPVMRAVHARLNKMVKEGDLTDDVDNLFSAL